MEKNPITCSCSFMFSLLVPACPCLSLLVRVCPCSSPLVQGCPRSFGSIPACLCPSPACSGPLVCPIPAHSGPSPLVRAQLHLCLFICTCACTRLYTPVFVRVHSCLCLRSFVRTCTHACSHVPHLYLFVHTFIRACVCGHLYVPVLMLVRTLVFRLELTFIYIFLHSNECSNT